MKRVAIVTAATGQGHLAAARALAEALRARGESVDTVDVSAAHPLVGVLAAVYNAFLRRPPRWMAAFFSLVNMTRPDRLAYRMLRGWALGEVRRLRPTAFISVHPMLNYGLAQALAWAGMDIPIAIVLTDLAPPLWRGWAEPRAAAVTAPTPQAADQLAAWGVPRDRIRMAPIPIRPAFRRPAADPLRRQTRRDVGLEDDRITVVLSAGTAGRAATLRAYRALAGSREVAGWIQALVLAGRDERVLREAKRVRPPFPAAVLSWRDDPEKVLAAADVLFTKPGGLTVSEALAAGIPLLLDGCGGVMPQERGNARWVVERGAGWMVEDPGAVPGILCGVGPRGWPGLRHRARAAVAGDANTVLEVLEQALGVSLTSGTITRDRAPVVFFSAAGLPGEGRSP